MPALDTLVHQLLDRAADTPDAVALVDGRRELGYGELARDAMAFARHLQARGIRAGDRVAVHLPNGLEAVVACYGTWLAGCAFVPLNAQAKSRDLAPQLANCGARVLVHEAGNPEAMTALLENGQRSLAITLGADVDASPRVRLGLPQDDAPLAAPDVDPDAPAAILYTAGTTGSPKGVTLTHRNLSSNVESIVGYLGLTAADVIVSVLPFYYSYGASVLHTHLRVGGRVVIHPNFVFPHAVMDAMARHRASGFSGVPSTFALLLDRVAIGDYDLSSLRYLTQAGGAMAPALAQRVCEAFPQARLFVMYGQTEATARLAWLPPEERAARPRSAGKAIGGVVLDIRDEAGRPLPPGAKGEVWARGANVMAGYWNAPGPSSEVLVDGWLRTGDIGHLDADGYLYLSGRRSDMIKSGAHRIHPVDIEEAICELPEVSEAAVVGVDDDALGQSIRAFVVPAAGAVVDADRVKRHCRSRLAGYKVPAEVRFVDDLPRTASGKIRRVALADPIPEEHM